MYGNELLVPLSSLDDGTVVLFTRAGDWRGGCRGKVAATGVKRDRCRVQSGRQMLAIGENALVSVIG